MRRVFFLRPRPRAVRGFTLIKLLIVISIVLALISISLPNFLAAQVRAQVVRAHNDLRVLATALEMYQADHRDYPYVQDQGGIEWQMPAGFPPAGWCTVSGPI